MQCAHKGCWAQEGWALTGQKVWPGAEAGGWELAAGHDLLQSQAQAVQEALHCWGNGWEWHCCLMERRWRPKGLAWAVGEQQGQVYEEWQAQETRTVRPSRGTVPQYLHKMSRSGNSSESRPLHANQRTSEEQEKVSDESAGLDLRYLARHSSGKDQRQQTGSKHTTHTKTALLPAVWAKVTAAPHQSWCSAQAGKQLGGMWWGLWCRLQTLKGLLMVEPGASCANGCCRHSLCLWASNESEVQG